MFWGFAPSRQRNREEEIWPSSEFKDYSQLWLNYQCMVAIARMMIKSDRTGSYLMHPSHQSWLVISKSNGTSTPKWSHSAKTGVSNRKNVMVLRFWELHCRRTALCESIRYQAKSEQNVQQDLIPRVRHGEAELNSTMQNFTDVTYLRLLRGSHWKRYISDFDKIQIKLAACPPSTSEVICAINCFLYIPTQVLIQLQGHL